MLRKGGVRSNSGYGPRYGIEDGAPVKKLDSLYLRNSRGGGVSDTKPHKGLSNLRGWRGGSVHGIKYPPA